MKRVTIQEALGKYDSKKGYRRTLIKEEPHIKELRSFFGDLKEDDLSPSSLQKLALILIGKNTRTDASESGKAFEGLVNMLGGYEALDTLNDANYLTEDNVVFLERHPNEAKALAPLIVSISKTPIGTDIKKVFSIAEKLKNPQELITVFKELELISHSKNAYFFINILSLLNQHNLNSDEVMPFLKGADASIIFIYQILETLAEKNPSLITQPNVIHLLKIKHHFDFHTLLKILPQDQETLDSLFQSDDTYTLGQHFWLEDIVKNFKEAGWDLHPYLGTILSGNIKGYAVRRALKELIELKLKPELLPQIVQTIFSHSHESTELMDAVKTLHKAGLDEQFLKIAFAVPKFSDRIAAALVTLQKAECYNEATKVYICLSPEHALGLAQFWIQFSNAECSDSSQRAAMLKRPQCASYTAEVIEFLQQHKLNNEKNVLAVCKAKLTSKALLNLLNLMLESKILVQPRLDILWSKLSFIKTLDSGAQCLANVGKLDDLNFDSLMSDPINAVALAENLGGKPFPKDNSPLKNPGAQDFSTIRKTTKILCQGYRQGLFSTGMSSEQRKDFIKAKQGKTVEESQKEIVVKIVGYLGNQALEEATERHIAEDTYSSFLKI
ncbi:Uncharacterised protein [Legionella steigerwaltii]|uniref:Uncharacterized protein n=1 Tax=Legionella steigerwaltii TaxID=460 RepID=A0A378LCI1_9GAMM|nr:hypothetical protein [Legionella steigerwaltii]KTD70326.1 hypothetical protein Lstg_3328 [Legionella steigerwaltii]STY24060.1 Uncharacterised protein [Legionella steigerwaltii]